MDEAALHVPVLLAEVMEALQPERARTIVDATFGRGGHARQLLDRMGAHSCLLALDKDPEAIVAAERLSEQDSRVRVTHGSFARLGDAIQAHSLAGRIDGVLLDLGVSSPQLDEPSRGFSFRADGPLDMRMNPETGPSAAEYLQQASEKALVEILRTYGEERYARRIARAILAERESCPVETTMQLAEIVKRAVPSHERGKHPATRTFQALRIRVNRELEELAEGLVQATESLCPGGRLAVISFHSLEDRMVKRFMRSEARPDTGPFPVPVESSPARLRLVGKPQRPTEAERNANVRARSAVLRVAERLS